MFFVFCFKTANAIATAILKSQYAHSKAFTTDKRLRGMKVTGHVPYNPEQMFRRHPGMARVEPAVFNHCLAKAEGPLLEVSCEQGFVTEKNLDAQEIPETDEQRDARAAGFLVKDKQTSPTNWRFCFLNHLKALELIRQNEAKKMALQDEIRIRAAAKLLLANAKVIFGRGDVVGDPTLFTQEQIEQYAFVPSDAEVKCQYCKGSKTTWVDLSLGTAASKKWRTTTRCDVV